MKSFPFLLFLFSFILFPLTLSDISIISPTNNKEYSPDNGKVQINIKWKDSTDNSNDQYSLNNAKSTKILLCAGSSTQTECFETLTTFDNDDIKDTTSYTTSFDDDVCDNGYYFFQFYTTFAEDATTIHYSGKFKLTKMKGDSDSLTVPYTVNGAPPNDVTEGGGGDDDTSIDTKSFGVYYTSQTGTKRYAPMQLQPGTKVTATKWSTLFPTSAVTYYSEMRKTLEQYSTTTPAWSYKVTSVHNWASPAVNPSVAYDPKERVLSAKLTERRGRRGRWIDY